MFKKKLKILVLIISASVIMVTSAQAEKTISIGINMPLTGERETSGANAVAGVELLRDQLNTDGGIEVGGTKYKLVLEIVDNGSSPQGAIATTLELISKRKVLAIVGPNASSYAIPSGNISQSFKTPMISPNSTNPKTTLNRPYVFRACFLDDFQGKVMADFAISELNATKAAVLFNNSNAYSRGLAKYFKSGFEANKGPGSLVAFEDFLTSEKDLTQHINRIISSGAEVLFLPQYAYEVPEIVSQARAAGWDKMILGGAAWASSDLEKCGELCEGLFFSSHFGALGVKGEAKIFVDQYKAKTNELPTGYAALAYDSLNLIVTAIKRMDTLSDNIVENRDKIRANLEEIKQYEGVTGTLDMNASGDPVKSAVVIRVAKNGSFESFKTVNP
jgi:branched-chain amino acid transport system substrate-binding protein